MSIVTDRRAVTLDERELRSALFCLGNRSSATRAKVAWRLKKRQIEGGLKQSGVGPELGVEEEDILLAFIGVTHFR